MVLLIKTNSSYVFPLRLLVNQVIKSQQYFSHHKVPVHTLQIHVNRAERKKKGSGTAHIDLSQIWQPSYCFGLVWSWLNFRSEHSLFLVNLPCNTIIILQESKEYTNIILYLPIVDSCGLQSIPEHLVQY